ncbi:DUF1499 domain-containing protein [Desulfofustis glycolicus]|uniref:Uncharacterized conserved protein, DUF1499 family n=1 Tax=Desulfofustis glycolicus DSM 9705 TaxID=1121409 RepID=A0A1M5SWK4_9BACT|nr:DUF1499 domain-containing protein [Desulfofustis glycolicus]SHH42894.1 Uncharacterized conserved protein, DUF1499 family [Desulfofustis glycolicus DSM 9705]
MKKTVQEWHICTVMADGDQCRTLFQLLQRIILMGLVSWLLAACSGTPPNDLGVHDGRLVDCPASPNCVSSQADDHRHHIEPLVFSDSPEQAFARLEKLLAERGDTAIVTRRPGYLRVEFRTTLFVDDGEFLLDNQHHVIHVRSASRLGYSDLGKNRSRIEQIRREFAGVQQ